MCLPRERLLTLFEALKTNSRGEAQMNNVKSLLMMIAGTFLAQAAAAQVLPSSAIYFPMIGITGSQTLQINLVAYPPSPCFAQMGFLDSNGNVVGQISNVMLQ